MATRFAAESVRFAVPVGLASADLRQDGSLLAFGGNPRVDGHRLRVYRTRDGALIDAAVPDAVIRGVAFSASGALWYLAERSDGTVDLAAWAGDGSHRAIARYGPGERLNGLARDAAGRIVAVTGNACEVWSTAPEQVVRHVPGATSDTRVRAGVQPEGGIVWLGGVVPERVVGWDLAEDRARATLPAPPGRWVETIVVGDGGRFVLCVGGGAVGVYLYGADGARLHTGELNERTTTQQPWARCDEGLITVVTPFIARDVATWTRVPGPATPRGRKVAVRVEADVAVALGDDGAATVARVAR